MCRRRTAGAEEHRRIAILRRAILGDLQLGKACLS
jgi:hypothetical protein